MKANLLYLTCAVLLSAPLLAQSPARAADVYVNIAYGGAEQDGTEARPFTSIQTGINRAIPGDVVHVKAGTYHESVTLRDQVDVIGDGYDSVIIDGQYATFCVEAYDTTDCLLKGVTITRGFAQYGAGVYLSNCTITIDGCLVSDCSAEIGGGIYATNMSTLTLSSTTVAACKASTVAAGIGINSSTIIALNCDITQNETLQYGGGLWLNNSTATIDKTAFSRNKALDGGGIYWKSSGGTLRRSIIIDNLIGRDGAGMFLEVSNPKLTRNYIADNYAYGICGGVYFWRSASAAMYNCLIVGNGSADVAGAVMCDEGGGTLINNTIVSNAGKSSVGGIAWRSPGSIPTVLNCIVWGNGDDLSNVTAAYSQIEDGDAGTGNGSANPLFTNTATRDYSLSASSPCINTGHPGAEYNDRDGTRNDKGYTGGPYALVPADVDDNGCVNILDLIAIRGNMGKDPSSGGISQCDVNKDGRINILDLIAVRAKLSIGCGKPQWP